MAAPLTPCLSDSLNQYDTGRSDFRGGLQWSPFTRTTDDLYDLTTRTRVWTSTHTLEYRLRRQRKRWDTGKRHRQYLSSLGGPGLVWSLSSWFPGRSRNGACVDPPATITGPVGAVKGGPGLTRSLPALSFHSFVFDSSLVTKQEVVWF